jgi:arylsulfatase A-like enzyme
VPLILKLPESRLAGSRVPWQVRQVDVAPTLATLAGAPLPALWQGADLLDERALRALAELKAGEDTVVPLEGEDEAPPADLLLETSEPGVYPRMDRLVFAETNLEGNDLSTVRAAGWKLITANEGNPRGLEHREMYKVSADPGEEKNLVGIEVAQQNKMETLVAEQVKASTAAGVSGTTADLDDVTLERMRALGYIE